MTMGCTEILIAVILCLSSVFGVCFGNTIEFRIPEEQKEDYFVGDVLTASNIYRDNLRFSLMSQGNQYESYFKIDTTTGNLTTSKNIDRETLCEFTETCEVLLEIAAQTAENTGFFAVVKVLVIIEDINDNGPVFAKSSVNLKVSEAVLTGATFTVDGARDKDTSPQFALDSYELVSLGSEIPFNMTFSKNLDGSSKVQLIVAKQLNREIKDAYQFKIVARDGGSPPLKGTLLVNVTVTDINDNYPVFSKPSYDVAVQEDVNINHVIMTLTATDEDQGRNGEIMYRLSPHQPSVNLQHFAVDENSGELRVTQHLNFNFGNSYKLIVEAIDKGDAPLTTQAFVSVTVLDTGNNPPEIYVNLLSSSNHASVSEYAHVGAVVAHVAVREHDSGRNGNINCSVISDVFGLQVIDTNEYKVIVDNTLDRERSDKHNVSVHCADRGLPPLTASVSFLVYVDDENDNRPEFRQQMYFANINENNEIGDVITKVSAFDLDSGNNGKILYSVSEASKKYAFVNPDTGVVMANKRFDRENKEDQNITLTVIAVDQGEPALQANTTVILTVNDLNDQKPIFDQTLFRFWIDENQLADTRVGKVTAKDDDEGSRTYFGLKNSDSGLPFVVLTNGVIKSNRQLDREQKSNYTFEVKATDADDHRIYSTANVTVFVVDKNDNSPRIELPTVGNDTAYVPYMTLPNSVIYHVKATDIDDPDTDNSKLTYSMTTLNKTNYFSIDAVTGEIELIAQLTTHMINRVIVLRVSVKDNGEGTKPTSATLHVRITAHNGTTGALTDEPNSNFVIAVAVTTVTVVISAGIIATICIIRRLDSRKKEKNARQKVLSENMYSKNEDDIDNVYPMGMDSTYQEKRKKEVSFSLEDNGALHNSQGAPDNEGQGHDSLDHILLEPPPQYQLDIPKGKLDDSHSDMSGDSNGDSGKGGSDDDLHLSHIPGLNFSDVGRHRDRWDKRRSKSPGVHQMTSFPTRYQQPNNVPNNQKIIPFSFKKPPSFVGNGLTNHVSPTTSAYSVPIYYEEDSQDSSGFQSIDSNSNFSLNNQRKVNLTGHRSDVPPDCVV